MRSCRSPRFPPWPTPPTCRLILAKAAAAGRHGWKTWHSSQVSPIRPSHECAGGRPLCCPRLQTGVCPSVRELVRLTGDQCIWHGAMLRWRILLAARFGVSGHGSPHNSPAWTTLHAEPPRAASWAAAGRTADARPTPDPSRALPVLWTCTVVGKCVTRSLTPRPEAPTWPAATPGATSARRLRDLLNEIETRCLPALEDAEG